MIHDVFATTGIIDVQGAPRGAGGSFAADVISGLSARHKRLPPKYFYDASGSPVQRNLQNGRVLRRPFRNAAAPQRFA
jgi:hypothetical protein